MSETTCRKVEDVENDSRLRAALERRTALTPAMLHSIDAAGHLVSVSDAWLDKVGYIREEVIGKSSTDFLTPESRDYALEKVLPEFFRLGRCDGIEYQMVCKNGRIIDVVLSAILLDDRGDCGPKSLAVITDVTSLKQAERRLTASEARYRGLVEDQSEMVSLATPEGRLLYVNHAYARLYQMTPQDMVGRSLFDFVPTEARETIAEHIRATCNARDSLTSENQIVLPNGKTRWMAGTNRAIPDPSGNALVIHSVGRDIEERVVAERQLKENEAKYRFLAEHSSDLILIIDAEGKRTYVSPACRPMLGFEPEEMLAMRPIDTIHPEDAQRVLATIGSPNRETNMKYRMRRKDGTYVWVETSRREVVTDSKAKQRLVVIRDIGLRAEAEERLRESESRYRLLADNSSDMVFQLDHNLVRRYVSPASRDNLGYEPSQLIGNKPADECHPEDAHRVAGVFGSVLSGEVAHASVINRRQHRDGRWIWVEARLKALIDPITGAVIGIIGALRDITLRKSIEDQLAQANRRLEILATQDGLTGLANRRVFDEALAREHCLAMRKSASLALIMIDIDCFKAFNDQYGHPAGDECLRRVAGAIAGAAGRPNDLAARFGGEEFAVLLPNADEVGAAEVAEAIRLAIRALALKHESGNDLIVTVSAGVSAIGRGFLAAGPDTLLKDADQALYRAKRGGRDRVVNASWPFGVRAQKGDDARREASLAR